MKKTMSDAFFNQSEIASGWVRILVQQVRNLETQAAVDHFASNFELQRLTSLMAVCTPHAEEALSGLFRRPLKGSGYQIPVPGHCFVSGLGGISNLQTRMYPSLAMSSDVVVGGGPLVQTIATPGTQQVPIELLACAFPNPLRGGWLLRALIDTPNEEILTSIAGRAVLHAAWLQVRPRFVLNILVDAATVAMATAWSIELLPIYSGWPILAATLCKELVEFGFLVSHYLSHGWVRQFFGAQQMINAVNFALFWCLLWPTVAASGQESSRLPLALFACMRWWRLLFQLRGFAAIGTRILPIIYTLRSMGPFFLVIVMLLLGFLTAFFALESDGIRIDVFMNAYRGGFLGELDGFSTYTDSPWLEPWLSAFIFVVGIIMVNILIGVLGESYDMHHDNAEVIFGREQGQMALDIFLLLYPQKKFWPHAHWMQALAMRECPGRCHDSRIDLGEAQDNRYLWVCAPMNSIRHHARLSHLKHHIVTGHAVTQQKLAQIQESLCSLVNLYQDIAVKHRVVTERLDRLEQDRLQREDVPEPIPRCPLPSSFLNQ